MAEHIFCYNCCHFDDINLCKTRGQLVKPSKGRFCQDFVDKTKILKPKEEIPQPVKIEEKVLEEVPVAPVETKLELNKEIIRPPIEVKLKWWQKILKFLLIFFKGR